MRHFSFRVVVCVVSFLFGVLITTILLISHKSEKEQLIQSEVTITETTPEMKQTTQSFSSFLTKEKFTPHDIEEFINANPQNDIQEVWEKLDINKNKFGNLTDQQESDFFNYCGSCKAENFYVELDGKSGSELLLKIEDVGQEASRYLIFKYKQDGWNFLGHIDHGFGRYEMPKHSTLLSSGKEWLVVRVQVGSGSGFALYYDRLFAVINDKVVEILDFPSDGHQSNLNLPSSDISARIIECKFENNTAIVKVAFDISYSTYHETKDEEILLWRKKQTAVFRKKLNSKKVIFDTKNSNLTEKEMKSIYWFDESSTNEDFVKYNFAELVKISLGKDESKKQWLEKYLLMCQPTLETKILQRNLKNKG